MNQKATPAMAIQARTAKPMISLLVQLFVDEGCCGVEPTGITDVAMLSPSYNTIRKPGCNTYIGLLLAGGTAFLSCSLCQSEKASAPSVTVGKKFSVPMISVRPMRSNV